MQWISIPFREHRHVVVEKNKKNTLEVSRKIFHFCEKKDGPLKERERMRN